MADKPRAVRFARIREEMGLENPVNVATYEIGNAIGAGCALAALMGFVIFQTWTEWQNPGALMLLIFEGAIFLFGSVLFVWGIIALLMKKAATKKPPATQPEAAPK